MNEWMNNCNYYTCHCCLLSVSSNVGINTYLDKEIGFEKFNQRPTTRVLSAHGPSIISACLKHTVEHTLTPQ